MSESEIKTTRGSRILVVIFVIAIIFSIGFSVYKYYISKDFILYVKALCEPTTEQCFVHECEEGDVRCSDYSDGLFYYKIIYQKQSKTPACTGNECPQIICEPDDSDCSVYYCSDENLLLFELEDECTQPM